MTKRLRLYSHTLSEAEVEQLRAALEILPPPHPPAVGSTPNRSLRKKARRKRINKWVAKLKPAQKKAWASLSPLIRNQYLWDGVVTIGVRPHGGEPAWSKHPIEEKKTQPIGTATRDDIIKSIEKLEGVEDFDLKRIDWGST